jgi:hypothetical protein
VNLGFQESILLCFEVGSGAATGQLLPEALDRRVTIVDSQVVVECTLESGWLVHHTETAGRMGYVSVSPSSVVCVSDTLGVNGWKHIFRPLLLVKKGPYRYLRSYLSQL